jgi:hypothetical protein
MIPENFLQRNELMRHDTVVDMKMQAVEATSFPKGNQHRVT